MTSNPFTFETIEKVLIEQVNPELAIHGGAIKLIEVKPDGTIRIAFRGACANCPAQGDTLKERVEVTLAQAFPHESFRLVVTHYTDPELLEMARNLLRKK